MNRTPCLSLIERLSYSHPINIDKLTHIRAIQFILLVFISSFSILQLSPTIVLIHLAFFLLSHVLHTSSQFLLSLIFFSLLFPAFVSTLLFCSFVLTPLIPSRDSPSLFRHSTALPRSSILSFVFLAASLSASLTLPLSPFIIFSFHWENVWYAGAFYTGMESPPPLLGLMAGKEQPGRLPVRTFVSARGHAVCVWPSTCNQETRTHAQSWARYREGNEWTVPTEMLSRIIFLIHWYRDLRQLDTPAENKIWIYDISVILNLKLKYLYYLFFQNFIVIYNNNNLFRILEYPAYNILE